MKIKILLGGYIKLRINYAHNFANKNMKNWKIRTFKLIFKIIYAVLTTF